MAFVAANGMKSLLSIKIKSRHDSITDQVSRIFVAKVFVVASIIMGVDWFHDSVTCIIPNKSQLKDHYVKSACWIQGFYIYPDLERNMRSSGHYGIPKAIEVDGMINGTNRLCSTKDRFHDVRRPCKPMDKHYFNQYQWIPFFVATLSILFYLPYIMFKVVNTDIISLKDDIKAVDTVQPKDLVSNYFDYTINSKLKMRWRVGINFVVKGCYVMVNVLAFHTLDVFLNSQFFSYGKDWLKWSRENTSYRLNFEVRSAPSPGNKMLPSFGLCDVHDASLDSVQSYGNRHKLICEVSSNMLYQYIFLILWLVLVISISISIFGVFLNIFMHIVSVCNLVKSDKSARYIYKFLTFRECEYLEFLRRQNLKAYGDVIRILRVRKFPNISDGAGEVCDAILESGFTYGEYNQEITKADDNFTVDNKYGYNEEQTPTPKSTSSVNFTERLTFFQSSDKKKKRDSPKPLMNGKTHV